MRLPLAPVVAVIAVSLPVAAAEYFVDPVNGAPTNAGTAAAPWSTLERVIADGKFGATIRAGDTVWLASGYHGTAAFSGGAFSPAITVAAAPGATPRLRRVTFTSTQGWVLRGVQVSPSFAAAASPTSMVSISANSSDIELADSELFTVPDASAWTASDWMNTAWSGVDVRGARVTVRRCTVRNVRFGITVTGERALVDGCSVVNFSADALRGLGNYGVFQFNEVRNVYVSDDDGDANHDDGFQSWSVGDGGVGTGEVVGLVLRGNRFVTSDDPNQPFKATMQGIGCFDGFFTDWVVENNVVIVDHWHGISLYGMRGGRIVNNTVIDTNTVSPGPPWIMVTAHKNGTPSRDAVVRNNLSTSLNVSGTNVTSDHNLQITMAQRAAHFVDPSTFDLHLLPGSTAVNAGEATLAPTEDRDRVPRPQGGAVDLGAYEWSPPGDGGAPAGGGTGAMGGGGGATGGGGGAAAGGGGTGGGGTGGGGAPLDGGEPDAVDGGTDPGAATGGCGCSSGLQGAAWALATALALAMRRRPSLLRREASRGQR